MPPTALNKNKNAGTVDKVTDNNTNNTVTRSTACKNGSNLIIEEHQDFNDATEGRKYLEKLSLICPPGKPATHQSLSTCLHQISALPGIQKPVMNTVRAVAFLLDELEETQINITVKDAFDSQLNEYTTDMLSLIKDAKDKIKTQIDKIEAKITSSITTAQNSRHTACNATANTPGSANSYVAALINPPPHANPRLAAREGIKAWQFAIVGLKKSAVTHLNTQQLKDLLNNIILTLGMTTGKIRSVTNT